MGKILKVRLVSLFKRKEYALLGSHSQAPLPSAIATTKDAACWAPPQHHCCDNKTSVHGVSSTTFAKRQSFFWDGGLRKKPRPLPSLRVAASRHQSITVTPTTIVEEFLKHFPPRVGPCVDGSGALTTPEMQEIPRNTYPRNVDMVGTFNPSHRGMLGSLINRHDQESRPLQNVKEGMDPDPFSASHGQEYHRGRGGKPEGGSLKPGGEPLSPRCGSEVLFDWDKLFLIRVAAVDAVGSPAPPSPRALGSPKASFRFPLRDVWEEKTSALDTNVEPSHSPLPSLDGAPTTRSWCRTQDRSATSWCARCGMDSHEIEHTGKEGCWLRMIDTFLRKRDLKETPHAMCGDSESQVGINSYLWDTPAVYHMYYHRGSESFYRAVGRFYAIPGLPQPPINFKCEWLTGDTSRVASVHHVMCNCGGNAPTDSRSEICEAGMGKANLEAVSEEHKGLGSRAESYSWRPVAEAEVCNDTLQPFFSASATASPMQRWTRATATVLSLNDYIAFICPSYCKARHEKGDIASDSLTRGVSFACPASVFQSHSNKSTCEPEGSATVSGSCVPCTSATSKDADPETEQAGKTTTTRNKEGEEATLKQHLIGEANPSVWDNCHAFHSRSLPESDASMFLFARPQSYASQSTPRGSAGWGIGDHRGESMGGGLMSWWCVPVDTHLSRVLPFNSQDGTIGRRELTGKNPAAVLPSKAAAASVGVLPGDRGCPVQLAWEEAKRAWVVERSVGVLLLLAEECIYFEMLLHVHNPLSNAPTPHDQTDRVTAVWRVAQAESDLMASRQLSFPQPPLLCTRAEDSVPCVPCQGSEDGDALKGAPSVALGHSTEIIFCNVVHRMELPFAFLEEGGTVRGGSGGAAMPHSSLEAPRASEKWCAVTDCGQNRVGRKDGDALEQPCAPHRSPPRTVLVYEAWDAYTSFFPLRFSDKDTKDVRTKSGCLRTNNEKHSNCFVHPRLSGGCYSTGQTPRGTATVAGYKFSEAESESALHRRLLSAYLDSGGASGAVRADESMSKGYFSTIYAMNSPHDKDDTFRKKEQKDNLKVARGKFNPASPTSSACPKVPYVAFSPFPSSQYLLKNRKWFAKPFVLAEEMRYGLLIKY